METQLDLLSHSRIARHSDPETSHEAAEHITKSGQRLKQQERVLRFVRTIPGCTSAEMAQGFANEVRFLFARRLPELRAANLVRNGEKRKCSVTGLNALTWWPA